GEDVLAAGSESWQDETATPDFWLHRVHALTGQQRWRSPVENRPSCPCARTADNVVLSASFFDREQFTPVPVALLGVDLRTGQLRWRQPVDAPPDALAASGDQVFLLTGGTLTVYADRGPGHWPPDCGTQRRLLGHDGQVRPGQEQEFPVAGDGGAHPSPSGAPGQGRARGRPTWRGAGPVHGTESEPGSGPARRSRAGRAAPW